ncbi:MAG: sensor histidine kinase [Lachnospiraceae bacterium]|nr:sensor histidine kinase [Lachnospiraceae bacterium]
MKELSLNILDIAENSYKAGASLVQILIDERLSEEQAEMTIESGFPDFSAAGPDMILTITIVDDGCGMTEEVLAHVTDPFYTTRKTRAVGLGLPFFKMEAEMTGGYMTVESVSEKVDPEHKGTVVTAVFHENSIDFIPLGDVVSTVTTLIQGHPDIDLYFRHTKDGNEVSMDTRAVRDALGPEVSLAEYEVIQWIGGSLREEYEAF